MKSHLWIIEHWNHGCWAPCYEGGFYRRKDARRVCQGWTAEEPETRFRVVKYVREESRSDAIRYERMRRIEAESALDNGLTR